MRKIVLLILFSLLSSVCYAEWKFNPHTGKLDYYESSAGGGSTSFDGTTPQGVLYIKSGNTASASTLIVSDGSNLSVGIGTTGNGARLYIKGAGTSAGFALRIADSISTDRLVVMDNGKVGIGTTNPTGGMQILTSTEPNLRISSSSGKHFDFNLDSEYLAYTNVLTLRAGTTFGLQTNDGASNSIFADTSGNVNIGTGAITMLGRFSVGTTPTAPLFLVLDSGNVGIGTSNPAYNLQVTGTMAGKDLRFGTAYDNILPAGTGANNQILKTNASGVITWQADNVGGSADFDNITINTNPAGQLQITAGTAPAGKMLLSSAGGTIWADTSAGGGLNNIVEDLTPQLGGDLDGQAFDITTTGSGAFTILTITGNSNLNNIASGTWNGDVLAIGKIPTIPLATKVSGTLPNANMSIIDLANSAQVSGTLPSANTITIPLETKVSGTLPLANTPIIPLTTQVSGTLPAANMTVVNLAGSMVSGTLPLANILTIPLATKTSGTLPDASAPVNITNNSVTSNTGSFTQLMIAGTNSVTTLKSAQFLLAGTDVSVNLKSGTGTFTDLFIAGTKSSTQLTTNTLRTGDTIPLMRLNVLNTAVGTLPGATLHINKAYLIDKMYAQILGVGSTNVVFTLRQNSADGTTPLYNLSAGQTATTALLTVTSFTGGSVPAGNLLVIDINSVAGGATAPSMRLEIFGHEQ